MIVQYEDKYSEAVTELLQSSMYSFVWGERAQETLLAMDNEHIIGIASVWESEYHPNRTYTGVFVEPAHRRKGLGKALFSEITVLFKTVKWQTAVSSKNKAACAFLTDIGFVRARRCYTPELNKQSLNEIERGDPRYLSIEEMDESQRNSLVTLQLSNYRTSHQGINALSEDMTEEKWEQIIFEDLDERHSKVFVVNKEIKAYIFCYKTDNDHEIEIAHIGGERIDNLSTYLPFYRVVTDDLIRRFETVSIEADDVDPFAYALLNCYDYDATDSWDAWIKN